MVEHLWGPSGSIKAKRSSTLGIRILVIIICLILSHCFINQAITHILPNFILWLTAAAKSLQSCPTLWDPIDGSPPGSPVPGILQARTLEWVATSFSSAWKWKSKWSRSVMSDSVRPHGLQPTRLLHPWDFPGKSTGVGCHCLLWTHAQIYVHWVGDAI